MADVASTDDVPGLRMLIGGAEGIQVLSVPSDVAARENVNTDQQPEHCLPTHPAMATPASATLVHLSGDGSLIATSDGERITVRSLLEPATLFEAECPRTQAIAFSPLKTYLLTWQRWDQRNTDEGAVHGGNLKVWRIADGGCVGSYMMRHKKQEAWPAIQWSADESVCARMVSNEVRIEVGLFDGSPRADPVTRVNVERVAGFSLAPAGMPLRLATYVPEKKGGNPGRVALWHIAPGAEPAAVRSKSIGMAEDVELKWSPTGSGLLVRSPPARKAAVVAPEAGSSPAPPPHPARKPPSTSAA